MNNKKKILVIYTGGTIGSVKYTTSDGTVIKGQPKDIIKLYPKSKDYFNSSTAVTLLCDKFFEEYPKYKNLIIFDNRLEMEVLSENMTLNKWNILLEKISKYDFSNYSGVIITHGTDTLAYTANLLAMIYNNIQVPLFIVSSNDSLDSKAANGIANFKGAIDFIINEKTPGVYVSYKSNIETDILYASRITQCKQINDSFETISSNGLTKLGTMSTNGIFNINDCELMKEIRFNKIATKIPSVLTIKNNILKISPYVGLNYQNYNISNCKAIIHNCYHSGTSCTTGNNENSILDFIRLCDSKKIDFYYGPIYGNMDKAIYETTNAIMKAGAKIVRNISEENAYIKLLLAYSIYEKSSEILKYIDTDINKEHIYVKKLK